MRGELLVTVTGWVATDPRHRVGRTGTPYTTFRLASTPRHRSRETGEWVDGRTEWITVKAWHAQAFMIAASVRRRDPVVVHGRLRTAEWTSDEGPRQDLELEVVAMGHDLTYGRSVFARMSAEEASAAAAGPESAGAPGPGAGAAPHGGGHGPDEPEGLDPDEPEEVDDPAALIPDDE